MTAFKVFAYLRFQRHRQGWPAVAGLLLLALAAGVQLFGVASLRAQAQELRTAQSGLRQQLARRAAPEETQETRLARFYAGLPATSAALQAVDTIHRSAGEHGVKLYTGEYRLAREGAARWWRYQITLPARSSYPQLRDWLADVMNAVPSAALDEISLRREDAGNGVVEARVRLSLFLGAP